VRRGLVPVGQPLTSAEPEGFDYPDPPAPPREQVWVQGALGGSAHLPEHPDPYEPIRPQRTKPLPNGCAAWRHLTTVDDA